jgi:mono/diheme cytochrome c family protein
MGSVIASFKLSFPVFFFAAVLLASAAPFALAASKTEADEKAGAALFVDKGCTFCHGVGGVGTSKAPSLANLRKDKAWPADKIKNQILNGGQKMPPFADSVTDQEVSQLIAYLLAKHRPAPPPAAASPANPPSQ